MTQTFIQRAFAPIRRALPATVANPIRAIATALLTPFLFSYRTGHFRSSLKMAAVSRQGEPIPWYTFPCIDFLKCRNFKDKKVLEFGGGQSTLWWAERAARVLTFEGDEAWYRSLQSKIPKNVDLHQVSMETPDKCCADVNKHISSSGIPAFDIVIIDGLYRHEMIDVASNVLSKDGIIIFDNSEGYECAEGFKHRGLYRVDFYGYAAGVVLPHCTSIFFDKCSFVFDPELPIRVMAQEY